VLSESQLSPPPPGIIQSINPVIRDVIWNKREFFYVDWGGDVVGRRTHLKDFCSDEFSSVNEEGDVEYCFGDSEETNRPYDRFCVIDMDGMGDPELILESPFHGNRLLFHYEDGVVYGFDIGWRGFKDIKADGSFRDADTGYDQISKMRFSKGKVAFNELCGFDWDGYTGRINYRIDGKEVDVIAVAEYFSEWDKKPDAEWYTYDKADF